jgi:ketosteroid isomerase-like protein
MWTKGEKVVSSRPSLLAKEEEVKQFFSNYVDRYNQKDVDGFLSCFSSKAIQNRTEGLGAIANLYTKLIDQSDDLRYQIEGMKIEVYQHWVDVKARFRVDQKLKKDGVDKVWKGDIRWVLVKEEGRLKISSLDFQNEKSP